MKVLLDSCVWGGAKSSLLKAGHKVIWAGDWSEDPGDAEILAKAHSEGRVLITPDKDFGELAIMRESPHSGIIRLVNIPARKQGSLAALLLERYERELQSAAILTATESRVRIRLADAPSE